MKKAKAGFDKWLWDRANLHMSKHLGIPCVEGNYPPIRISVFGRDVPKPC